MAAIRIALALVFVELAIGGPIQELATNRSFALASDYRLNGVFAPSLYTIDLRLETDFGTKEEFFVDKAEITVAFKDTTEDVDKMQIHFDLVYADDIAVKVVGADAEVMDATLVKPVIADTQIYSIELKDDKKFAVANGPFVVTFTGLRGKLRNDMKGFYLSTYQVGDEPRYIATTQFQPSHARSAFPCFDEPEYKAKFIISITKPVEYTSTIANMKRLTTDPLPNNMEKFNFMETPTMSTYIIAFVVSKLEYTGVGEDEDRIYYPEGSREAGQYAFDITPKIIEELNKFTGLPYKDLGNEQMYQVAVPDFSAGAMENWGLATYRETALLWDPNHSTNQNKQRVATVIAHEISHMWFGDYVTMKWWSETWLNEGFARYFQYFCTKNVEQTWELDEQFVVDQIQTVFNADAVYPGTPLSSVASEVNTLNDINHKFATISYNKGASVIRMIEHAMPEGKFQLALQEYLRENEYKNTVPSDLLSILEKHELRAGSMKEWTENPGYPVIKVEIASASTKIRVTQEPFVLTVAGGKDPDTKWTIPVTYATETHNSNFKETRPVGWLLSDENPLEVNVELPEAGWIVVNVQQTGYYRVDYDPKQWIILATALRQNGFSGIHRVNRAQIVDDVFAMARVKRQSYSTALDVSKYLEKETDYLPWASAFNAFSFMRNRIGATSQLGQLLSKYILATSNSLLQSVSFNVPVNTKQTDVLKTALALQWACNLNDEYCTAESKRLFAAYRQDPAKYQVGANIRNIVYCNGIRHGNEADYNFMRTQYVSTKLATELVLILNAMGCARDEAILNTYLQESIKADSIVRKQDRNSMFTSALNGNAENVATVFEFLKNNYAAITQNYGGLNPLSGVINSITDQFTTKTQVDEFAKFIDDNMGQLGEAANVAPGAIAKARANVEWLEQTRNDLQGWLERELDNSAAATGISLLLLGAAVFINLINI